MGDRRARQTQRTVRNVAAHPCPRPRPRPEDACPFFHVPTPWFVVATVGEALTGALGNGSTAREYAADQRQCVCFLPSALVVTAVNPQSTHRGG